MKISKLEFYSVASFYKFLPLFSLLVHLLYNSFVNRCRVSFLRFKPSN